MHEYDVYLKKHKNLSQDVTYNCKRVRCELEAKQHLPFLCKIMGLSDSCKEFYSLLEWGLFNHFPILFKQKQSMYLEANAICNCADRKATDCKFLEALNLPMACSSRGTMK